jgi:hypothetical protein
MTDQGRRRIRCKTMICNDLQRLWLVGEYRLGEFGELEHGVQPCILSSDLSGDAVVFGVSNANFSLGPAVGSVPRS